MTNITSAGTRVTALGISGFAFALLPLLFKYLAAIDDRIVAAIVFLYVMLVGGLFTGWWSDAIHSRSAEWAAAIEETTPAKGAAARLPWIPAWIGIFERFFFTALLGFDVASGAAFVGVWVGIKLAGGWQPMSSTGSSAGRATFFVGLLGNAMSVLFGVVGGVVVRALLSSATTTCALIPG